VTSVRITIHSSASDVFGDVIVGKPMCAVCGHPVERLTEERHPFFDRTIFTAYCHGDTETVTIDWTHDLGGRGSVDPSLGTAFANSTRRLAP
jgi:hypothetical protein